MGNARRAGMYLASGLFVLLGASTFAGLIRNPGNPDLRDPITTVVFGGGMICLGYAGLRYVQTDYRGGLASIAGAVLAFFAAFWLAFACESPEAGDRSFLLADLAFGALFLAIAAWLLRRGHRRHLGVRGGEQPNEPCAPIDPRPTYAVRALSAAATAGVAALLFGVFGKAIEPWAFWVIVASTFVAAWAFYGKVD